MPQHAFSHRSRMRLARRVLPLALPLGITGILSGVSARAQDVTDAQGAVVSSGAGTTPFTGVNINNLVGANTFYNAGFTGTNARIANVEAEWIWTEHEVFSLETYAGIGVTGRVVDTGGAPITGVTISVELLIPQGNGFSTGITRTGSHTDADGRFTVTDIPANADIRGIRAEKAGYQFVRGGLVARADGTPGGGRMAGDIVLVALTGRVAGSVVDPVGHPLAGASVLVSECALPGASATTDAKGRFTLSGLPQSEVTLIVGLSGRGVVAVSRVSTSGDGPAPIVTIEPPAPSTVPGPERAEAVVRRILADTASKDFYARSALPLVLAPYAPDSALALMLETRPAAANSSDEARSAESFGGIIETLIDVHSPLAITWGMPRVGRVPRVGERVRLTALLTDLVGEQRPDRAPALYRASKADADVALSQDVGWERAYVAGAMAGAAYRWGSPADANRYTTECISAARTLGSQTDEVLWMIAEDLALRQAYAPAKRIAEAVSPAKRLNAYLGLIEGMSRHSPATAYDFLKTSTTKPGADGDRDDVSRLAMATRYVATSLAPSDPKTATTLARDISDPGERSLALALVASQLPTATAAPLFREAVVSADPGYGRGARAAQIAALAFDKDKTLGTELFKTAKHQSDEDFAAFADKDPAVNRCAWAYYAAHVDPVESRLTLEREWARAGSVTDANSRLRLMERIALAMAPADIDRALEMAEAIPTEPNVNSHFDALRKLAQYLIAPASVRRTISYDRWGASDTWTPGTPTGW